ncbi:MAG: glycogen/starch synthase [Bdellovibrionales bacterium]|nr:glycogen/starch synthase [Bdellovibrionales bacterium]
MQLARHEHDKDLQLKLALTDTDLLNVLRSSQGVRAGAPKTVGRQSRKSDVVARLSTRQGTLTFTGILYQRFPVHFLLKPGSRSYVNFLEFLVRELRALSASSVTLVAKSSQEHTRSPIGAPEAVKDITSYLENELRKLDRQAQASVTDITDIVDVFSDDFEQFELALEPDLESGALKSVLQQQAADRAPRVVVTQPIRSILGASVTPHPRKFRLFDSRDDGPQLISGFFSLEIEEFDGRTEEDLRLPGVLDDLAQRTARALRQRFERLGDAEAMVSTSYADVVFRFGLPSEAFEHSDFFVHWGRKDEPGVAGGWIDEEVHSAEIHTRDDGVRVIRKRLTPESVGRYGATLYACSRGTRERFWFGGSDAEFEIKYQELPADFESLRVEMVEDIEVQGKILRSLSSYELFLKTLAALSRGDEVRDLSRLLYNATKSDLGLRSVIAKYYQRAVTDLELERRVLSKPKLRRVVSMLQNIGIGEVVFIAPEGPHAIAGGLAQVIVGLTKALTRRNISCTIISPLYEEAQGNKHRSAEELLHSGVLMMGQRVPIERVGDVRIHFGPTFKSGTREVVQFPRISRSDVYFAENEGVRIFFLRHPKLADRLYASGGGDDQLRRAIFLSRGALEIMRDRRFGVSPHLLVTNDWLSGLVPLFLRVDPRYAGNVRLRNVESVHIIHNGGRAYQGRFFSNQFDEDLWPLLGVDDEHYFGLADPSDRDHINLTAAAVYHSSRGTVAVSRPYARQLVTEQGGEGLHDLFRAKRTKLFGISNGVDLAALRTIFWRLGERARQELGLEPLITTRLTHAGLLKRLEDYKAATKLLVQRKHGLREDPKAVLISLVGRLAEQKGLQLLAGRADGDTVNVLEAVLREFPQVQFLIGGPPTIGDPVVDEFAEVLQDLSARYAGRVRGIFDFIPHEEALEITQSSDLFLMPSRYEPGGITQLEALATGTLVIARKVGGIAATLDDYSAVTGLGNSFLFRDYTSTALKHVVYRALETIADPLRKRDLVTAAAAAEHDWGHRAPKYLALLQYASGALDAANRYEHLEPRVAQIETLKA